VPHDAEPDETDLHDPSSLRALSIAAQCYSFGRRLKPSEGCCRRRWRGGVRAGCRAGIVLGWGGKCGKKGGSAMARNAALYDEDFYAWSMEQARRLRAGEFSQLDIENIAEELESMGRSDKREIESRLIVLLAHLLKWQVQVGFRSRSWSATIREQRDRIDDLLSESPSLRSSIGSVRPALYARARRVAADETGLSESAFPADCPFTADRILAEDFLPEG
jgi:hypothetical protein